MISLAKELASAVLAAANAQQPHTLALEIGVGVTSYSVYTYAMSMASNLSGLETDSNDAPARSGEIEQCSDAVPRLRTGRRGRPPLDPSQKGLAEVCSNPAAGFISIISD